MRILAIDSSAGAASAAIWEDGSLLGEFFTNTRLTHSQTLMPMIGGVLDCARVPLESIDLFAVSAGPGSFTGVRIGVASIKGLAMAQGKPCAGVSTLEAMARNLAHLEGLVCAVMDARCGQVYNALFLAERGTLTRLTVSYTHLDVYKRQAVVRAASPRTKRSVISTLGSSSYREMFFNATQAKPSASVRETKTRVPSNE